MTIRALSSTSVDLTIGAAWSIVVSVVDSSGFPADDTPTVTVTLPGGSTETPSVETVTTGVYSATYLPAVAGRYVALVTSPTNGAADFAAYVAMTTTELGMPTVDDVATYLGEDLASPADDTRLAELEDALNAEAAAQRRACRVGATYLDDLRQALLRRVQRNLAMRQLPIATAQGDADLGPAILPGRDPEVRRLEAPHRRLPVG